MKKKSIVPTTNELCGDGKELDPTEYVILRTVQMPKSNDNSFNTHNPNNNNNTLIDSQNSFTKSNNSSNIDSLSKLLQESESVTKFRHFLDSINRGHYLDFWFACQGFRNFDKTDTHKLYQLTKVIYRVYIRSESLYSVPLELSTKKSIVDKLSDRNSHGDQRIFDKAQEEIRILLSGEILQDFVVSGYFNDDGTIGKSASNTVTTTSSDPTMTTVAISSNHHSNKDSTSVLLTSHSTDAIVDLSTTKCNSNNTYNNYNNNKNNNSNNSSNTKSSNIHNYNNSTTLLSSLKDRKNLSEIEPAAFARLLTGKLEQVQVEQEHYNRLMTRLMSTTTTTTANTSKVHGSAESDTDDSSSYSVAINYLLRYQLHHHGMSFKRVIYPADNDEDDDEDEDELIKHQGGDNDDDNDYLPRHHYHQNAVVSSSHHHCHQNKKPQQPPQSQSAQEEDQIMKCFTSQAHDILESHCSRIGQENSSSPSPFVSQKSSRHHHSHHHHHSSSNSHSRRRLSHSRERSNVNLVGEGKTSSSRKRRDKEYGSTTSYDSGVATSSLEQYSSLGMSGSVAMLDNNHHDNNNNKKASLPPPCYPRTHPIPPPTSSPILYPPSWMLLNNRTGYLGNPNLPPSIATNQQTPVKQSSYSNWPNFLPKNTNSSSINNPLSNPNSSVISQPLHTISSPPSSILDTYKDTSGSHLYPLSQNPALPHHPHQFNINSISDVSSNFDSGISCAYYDHLGRQRQSHNNTPFDDKVHRWINKQPEWSSTPSTIQEGQCQDNLNKQENVLINQQITQPTNLLYPNFHPPNTPQIPPRPMKIENSIINCNNQSDQLTNKNANYTHIMPVRPMKTVDDNPNQSDTTTNKTPVSTIVIGYYIGNDPVPYRTQAPLDSSSNSLTLGQFKNIVAKRGNFKYFFKRYCDEFECGLVHEEITNDDAVLPLWDGKIVAKIERID